jgi:hypothetical protein
LLATLAAGLGAGCVSTDAQKFNAQVRSWVPIGTPLAEAERIMTHHGFECQLLTKNHPFNSYGVDYLDCAREQIRLHDWSVKLFIRDGKVSGYGRLSVDDEVIQPEPGNGAGRG